MLLDMHKRLVAIHNLLEVDVALRDKRECGIGIVVVIESLSLLLRERTIGIDTCQDSARKVASQGDKIQFVVERRLQ